MSKTMVLAVIGGGSSQWMISLMKDVYLLDAVDGGEIRLVDPDRGGAEAVASMLARFNAERGKDYRISVCDDRAEALGGADFVMTTFSPGSMDAFEYDLEIPIRYGIRQPVSMTVGPAGISAALRTVPVAAEVVQDMERHCPGAWLLNVTNPMSAVTRAMNLAADSVHVVGLCHEFHAFPALGRRHPGPAPAGGAQRGRATLPVAAGAGAALHGGRHQPLHLDHRGRAERPRRAAGHPPLRARAPRPGAGRRSVQPEQPARRQAGAVPNLRLPAAGRRPPPGGVLAAPVQRTQRLCHALRGGENDGRLAPPPPRTEPRARRSASPPARRRWTGPAAARR